MRIRLENFLTLYILIIAFQLNTYGWIATLKVMHHADGHLIRLAGDVHLEAFVGCKNFDKAVKQEERFLANVEQPLINFISGNRNEYLIVEKVIPDLAQISNFLPDILSQGDVVLMPLITLLNILAYSPINSFVKTRVADIGKLFLQSEVGIVSYGIRSKYRKLSEMSFPRSQEEYDLFYKELVVNQSYFKNDIQELIGAQGKYSPKFINFIVNRGKFLIEKIKNRNELENFFIYQFADFGYLTLIAQNSSKNLTLYLGIIHCHTISQDLEEIGYKTIFERALYQEEAFRNNIIPGCCSKKEYEDFFSVGKDPLNVFIRSS